MRPENVGAAVVAFAIGALDIALWASGRGVGFLGLGIFLLCMGLTNLLMAVS